MKYDLLVFIGRFQPLHLGHNSVINKALTLSKRVLVLVGSANRSRCERNPWTFEERKLMITANYLNEYQNGRLIVKPLNDHMYHDDLWVQETQDTIRKAVLSSLEGNNEHHYSDGLNDVSVGLIGCEKDHTSYYLNLFPTFGSERVDYVVPLNSTDIRNIYFDSGDLDKIESAVTSTTKTALGAFTWTQEYSKLQDEIAFNKQYKESVAKYPRIEHTVDAVVLQSGHVLLVRRRAEPGKGKWALPGGFVNPTEKLKEAMLRELKEETRIKVPRPVLEGRVRGTHCFDDPNRSARARIITQAFLIDLPPGPLPKVKGSDDADKAVWVPISQLDPTKLFEDHYFIIKKMIGLKEDV